MVKTGTNQRIHGIDALRAIAMLLGIVLHATTAYKTMPLAGWPEDNLFQHWIFDYAYLFIHSFRMPLFFLIAGYFCRFLLQRIGEKAFIVHRWKRIGIPFLVSLVFILPLTIFPFFLSRFHNQYPGDWNTVFRLSFRGLFQWNGIAHLWFLYYLLMLYTITIILKKLTYFPAFRRFVDTLSAAWKRANPSLGGWLLVSVLPVWLLLLPGNGLFIQVDTGLVPNLQYLAFYAYFFTIGWLINIRPEIFAILTKRVWWLVITGLLLSVYLFYLELKVLPGHPGTGFDILAKGAAAFQILLLVLGSIGFFLKYFTSENALWKYISDASYWMYLLHLGLVIGLQIYLTQTAVPGWLRFPVVLLATGAITLLTYHFCVRYTIIGEYLHGERKKRKNPQLT